MAVAFIDENNKIPELRRRANNVFNHYFVFNFAVVQNG